MVLLVLIALAVAAILIGHRGFMLAVFTLLSVGVWGVVMMALVPGPWWMIPAGLGAVVAGYKVSTYLFDRHYHMDIPRQYR